MENQEKKESKELKKMVSSLLRKEKRKELIILIVLAVVLVIAGCLIIKNVVLPGLANRLRPIIDDKPGVATVSVTVSLTEAVRTATLYTAEYPYSSYMEVREDGSDNIKYYVRYSGTIKAGFDMDQIKVTVDEENHTVEIRLPKIDVKSIQMNSEDLDFIFTNDRYNTETVFLEGAREAQIDLTKKAQADMKIVQLATENAKVLEKSLAKAQLAQLDPEHTYTIKVLAYDEKEPGDASGNTENQ